MFNSLYSVAIGLAVIVSVQAFDSLETSVDSRFDATVCLGGEATCSHTKEREVNCQINQSNDNNPCAANEGGCAPPDDTPTKCISVSMTTAKYKSCFNPNLGSRRRFEKTCKDCDEEAAGFSCATVKTGDAVDGECDGKCTTSQGTCGSGVRTTTVTDCETDDCKDEG